MKKMESGEQEKQEKKLELVYTLFCDDVRLEVLDLAVEEIVETPEARISYFERCRSVSCRCQHRSVAGARGAINPKLCGSRTVTCDGKKVPCAGGQRDVKARSRCRNTIFVVQLQATSAALI